MEYAYIYNEIYKLTYVFYSFLRLHHFLRRQTIYAYRLIFVSILLLHIIVVVLVCVGSKHDVRMRGPSEACPSMFLQCHTT